MKNILCSLLLLLIFFACHHEEVFTPQVNNIQVVGSHNSYKMRMDTLIWQGLFMEDSLQAMQLDYGHISLTEQLDLGLRSLEIDVYHDPEGGKFKHPFGLKMIEMQGGQAKPFDTLVMESPGLKVLHNHDFDFRSNCGTFRICLEEIKSWSINNHDHYPIIITLNTKEEFIDRPGFTKPFLFSEGALDTIDMEILSVFEENQLIRPDDIRGDSETLEKAILTKGWGDLEKAKGKLIFVLDQNNEIMDRYIKNHPSLKERVMFVNAPVGTAEAAFLILNDPIEDFDLIQKRVKEGYLVRTRADAGTWEARKNDKSRFEKAKASGAHVISTDYYLPEEKFENDFKIILSGDKYYLIDKNKFKVK